MSSIDKPLDLIRLSIDEIVFVKCKGNRELRGKLHAYDNHLNLILGDAEETIRITKEDEETGEEITSEITRPVIPILFVRGDAVILVAPPMRTA